MLHIDKELQVRDGIVTTKNLRIPDGRITLELINSSLGLNPGKNYSSQDFADIGKDYMNAIDQPLRFVEALLHFSLDPILRNDDLSLHFASFPQKEYSVKTWEVDYSLIRDENFGNSECIIPISCFFIKIKLVIFHDLALNFCLEGINYYGFDENLCKKVIDTLKKSIEDLYNKGILPFDDSQKNDFLNYKFDFYTIKINHSKARENDAKKEIEGNSGKTEVRNSDEKLVSPQSDSKTQVFQNQQKTQKKEVSQRHQNKSKPHQVQKSQENVAKNKTPKKMTNDEILKKFSIIVHAIEARSNRNEVEQKLQNLISDRQELEDKIQSLQSKLENNIQEIELLQLALDYKLDDKDFQLLGLIKHKFK